jgi:hypothetical protein
MIDNGIIKEHYSQMTDEQLLNLVKTEGEELTPEALSVLHEEFINRNLDLSAFAILDDNKNSQRKLNIEKAQEAASGEFINALWNYAFDEKRNGTSNEEIKQGLIEKGLDEQTSSLIINSLESKAKEILDAHDTDMLRGALTCAAGLIITIWTYNSALNGGTYIVAWGAIIFGAIRFFRGVTNTAKYKTIIANIQAEEHNKEKTTA